MAEMLNREGTVVMVMRELVTGVKILLFRLEGAIGQSAWNSGLWSWTPWV